MLSFSVVKLPGEITSSLCNAKPETAAAALEQYRKLKLVPEFRSVREKIPFMAIWNFHDFNGIADNATKEAARTEFVKRWSYLKGAVPADQKALYHSKIFGGKKQEKVQVIVLDTRWDRSDLKKNPDDKYDPKSTDPTNVMSPYLPDTEKGKHILSNEQWNWLEHELKKPADLRILVSPIQVIADDHGFEKWGNFPNEREKLFVLLQKSKIKNLIIFSGDRHLGALAQIDIKKNGSLFEMTSSGLNSTSAPGNMLTDKTYFKDGYPGPNFGLATIHWDRHVVTLQIKTPEDEVKTSYDVKF